MPNIERMLELNTRLANNAPNNKQQNRVNNQQDLDKLIENYDKQVFGPSQKNTVNEGHRTQYSAEDEMRRLRQINENGGHKAINLEGRNIPQGIVESILNNPLDLNPNLTDTKMAAFENKLAESMGGGIQKSVDVLKEVEKRENEARQKLTEQNPSKQSTVAAIDYEHIKILIENAIDKKIKELSKALNESKGNTQVYVPSMKLLNFKDKFHFVDSDDNVFVCEMKYLGKRKKIVK